MPKQKAKTMKVYLVLDVEFRTIRRIYTRKKDAKAFIKNYADWHCMVEELDTLHNKFPKINEETEQRWAVVFTKENEEIIDIIRGVSIKEERVDNLMEKGTTTIFVNALTRTEAMEKAERIFYNEEIQ